MSQKIRITRTLDIPDRLRLARYRRAPELGPRILFFSGGTALRAVSREILQYTHNSVHLITPFDSGGSSAKLREAFHMLAVGDIRNRLMALADRSLRGNPEIFELFTYRFPKVAEADDLKQRLEGLIKSRDPLIRNVPDPLRKIVRGHLRFFAERMPDDFDLRGASIGNLILTGGFFNNDRHIDPVIYLFSKLVEARGTVRPIVNRDLHLACTLDDGRLLVGQHLITGKETEPLASPIKSVHLAKDSDNPEPVKVGIRKKIRELITPADLICYPMGSFYSSIVANLLPQGVGDAVREADCPRVYVPNLGNDPEMVGMSLFDAVRELFRYLEASCSEPAARGALLNFIMVDTKNGDYGRPLHLDRIRRMGVEVLDVPLVSSSSAPLIDEALLLEHLLSLV